MALHRHPEAYAALVLEGRYEESSADGRYVCEPGVLVRHPAHHVHVNSFGTAGARVLNVTLPSRDHVEGYQVVHPSNASMIERLMRHDPVAAADAVLEVTGAAEPCPASVWVERMAGALRHPEDDGVLRVSGLARSLGKSPAHASRTFRAQYGLGPAAFRREHRARLAINLLRGGYSIADAALLAGYSDQSHLGRDLRWLTGRTPKQWQAHTSPQPRMSNSF